MAQNKMIRFILDLGPRVTISEEYLEKVKMLRIADRVTQLRLNHVFNIVNGSAPSYLTQILFLMKVEQEVQIAEIL